MKPEPATVLGVFAELIAQELGAAADASYGIQQLARGAMLLSAVAEQFDNAAAWRRQENQALRELLRDALARMTAASEATTELLAELHAAAQGADNDLRVSRLQQDNEGLRALLIRLQCWAEQQQSPAARAIEQCIWDELRRGTERRRLSIHRF